ncbi:MAG: hypothetical protein H6735_11975 [Alphaproteobacteria bacterium]|nr:hypothetical protein [Alphaproteobacteria bacterium]
MNRSAPVVPLRGSDSSLLQVQIPEMLRRPIGQVALVNVMDLVQLSITEGRPKAIDKQLQTFVGGVGRQVADIPRGRSWEMFVEDLEELPASQVPEMFREVVRAEAERRSELRSRVDDLLARWAEVEPEPFEIGTRHVRIQKAQMQQPRGPSPESSAAPRERTPRAGGSSSSSRSSGDGAKTSTPRAKPILDTERHDYVVRQCVERLSRCTSDRGLAETVLVAGVRHAGRDLYPDMTPIEITTILKQLRDANRVRYSAGRWSVPTRF